MQSAFDLNNQRTESKIVVALERISEAFRVLLWQKSKEYGLSTIQIQLLIFLNFHNSEKCTVSYLAQEFNMTKATVSDSLRILEHKKLIDKYDNPEDSRSYYIKLTKSGSDIAHQTSGFAQALENPLKALPENQKTSILEGLTKIIFDLNQTGIISIQRMCYTCKHYRKDGTRHFCSLLQAELKSEEIRLDCPEHQFAT